MKKTILIDDISSIKHNHFSFKINKKIITDYPFVIKNALNGDPYHFDKEDLEIMSRYEKDLAPHEDTGSLSRTEYIEHMKGEFRHSIRSGSMDYILTKLYKLEDENFQLKWEGPIDYKVKI